MNLTPFTSAELEQARRPSVEDAIRDISEALALTTLLSLALVRQDDIGLSRQIKADAFHLLGTISERAYQAAQRVSATLDAGPIFWKLVDKGDAA
jgi:hypothetical protein